MLKAYSETQEEGSAADAAYDGIIDLILHSELRPGERTSVNLLAARLGLGRTPVKEAITRLETEGLLSVVGRSGTTVNRIGAAQTEQLFAMRRALEDFAAEKAVVNATVQDIRLLKKCLQSMGRSNSTAEFVKANVEFHARIVAAAGNQYLVRFYDQLQMQVQIVTYLLRQGFDQKSAGARQLEHAGIVDALERRDGKALRTALRNHASTTETAILAALAESEGRNRTARVG